MKCLMYLYKQVWFLKRCSELDATAVQQYTNNILRSFKALCLETQWMSLDCYSKNVNIKNSL